MKSLKKGATDAMRLHAALAETDPSSIDLILIREVGTYPGLRLPALAYPPLLLRAAPRPVAASRPSGGRSPSRRPPFAVLPA
jgi:hypothetical protein